MPEVLTCQASQDVTDYLTLVFTKLHVCLISKYFRLLRIAFPVFGHMCGGDLS